MEKIELLAPAGDLEKLKYALIYGADAVYIGGQIFGLRASAKNFSFEEMAEGIEFAHSMGKKVHLVLNIIPHNEDLDSLSMLMDDLGKLDFDAFILSDPGTLMMVKEKFGDRYEIHLSTQANNTNYLSASFWHTQGVKRVILAREMSFDEINEIIERAPKALDFEAFIHGAMCISYSGRCLLSNYMNNRDANRGECSHPCRWKYHLVEEKRPNEYYPVVESENGTFFFNSKDLCMIEHVPELIESGLASVKIEGRMKSLYYVANTVRVYREAIDRYYENRENYVYDPKWLEEIEKVSHREFTTGFYTGKPGGEEQLYGTSAYLRNYDFLGVVQSYDPETQMATIEQRNRIIVGDDIEIIGPNYYAAEQKVTTLLNEKDQVIESAPHAQQIIKIKMDQPVEKYFILRKRSEKSE
ncbi:MAG: U32 family peptidase [Clostridia bacterium]|nr:U32 family peptidase [Clostridia bacterium]